MTIGSGLFLAFLVVQRLAELAIARRNTVALMARGAREIGAGHYPMIVALHAAWVLGLIWFGHDQPVRPGWLAAFVVIQFARLWVLVTLGSRWTTRIIVLDEPLVARGPYRFVRHPNYMIVTAEIFVAPMVLGQVWLAVVFTVLNAVALAIRIRVEHRALYRKGLTLRE